MKKTKKILFTGSHGATTAISIIQMLKHSRKYDWQISWIGSKRSFEGAKINPFESKFLPKLGCRYYSINSGRVQMRFSIWTIPAILKILLGFFESYLLIRKIKPDIVFSLGGSAGFLVSLCAFFARIPVFVHEQTSVAGRANLLTGKFAKKILISRENSRKFYPLDKTFLVGNPIRESIKNVPVKKNPGLPPVLLILGGSRGSKVINNNLKPKLQEILKNYKVIHQTGSIDYPAFLKLRLSLPTALKDKYEVFEFIKDMEGVYKASDIIISRAGANMVSEIMAVRRPSILIPIPWSYKNEQMINAQIAQKYGVTLILTQNSLTPAILLQKINEVFLKWQEMATKKAGQYIKLDVNANKLICDIIENSL